MYLNSCFVQFGGSGQLLAHINVWIVALAEGLLQLGQLLLCEGGAVSAAGGGRRDGGVRRGGGRVPPQPRAFTRLRLLEGSIRALCDRRVDREVSAYHRQVVKHQVACSSQPTAGTLEFSSKGTNMDTSNTACACSYSVPSPTYCQKSVDSKRLLKRTDSCSTQRRREDDNNVGPCEADTKLHLTLTAENNNLISYMIQTIL